MNQPTTVFLPADAANAFSQLVHFAIGVATAAVDVTERHTKGTPVAERIRRLSPVLRKLYYISDTFFIAHTPDDEAVVRVTSGLAKAAIEGTDPCYARWVAPLESLGTAGEKGDSLELQLPVAHALADLIAIILVHMQSEACTVLALAQKQEQGAEPVSWAPVVHDVINETTWWSAVFEAILRPSPLNSLKFKFALAYLRELEPCGPPIQMWLTAIEPFASSQWPSH